MFRSSHSFPMRVCWIILITTLATAKAPAQESESEYANWNIRIGTQLIIGRLGTENLRAFVSIVKAFEITQNISFDASVSINAYSGGLGTQQGNTRHWHLVCDGNLAGGFTLGMNAGRQMSLNVFHSFSGNVVNSAYGESVSFGIIQMLSSAHRRNPGRNQANGYVFFKIKDVSVGMYNDLFVAPILRQDDSYWTGGGEIQVKSFDGVLALAYYGFTGDRPNLDFEPHIGEDGQAYYDQLIEEQKLNNGLTSLKFSTDGYTFALNHTGNGVLNSQWLQNFIHSQIFKRKPIPWFRNTSRESLQLSFGKIWNTSLE